MRFSVQQPLASLETGVFLLVDAASKRNIMTDTSAGLLTRVRDRSNSAAWTRLVALYSPLLQVWARRAGVSPYDIDDVVQEVLLAVAREMPRFVYDATKGQFRAWLRTILTHRCRHHLRTRPATVLARTDWQVLDELVDPSSVLSAQWDREHDQHVAARLLTTIQADFEPHTWTAFRRVVLDGASPREVSAELGVSVDSVYQARSRVLSRLRREAAGLLD